MRRTRKRAVAVVPLLVLAGLGLAGCGTEQKGTAAPQDGDGASTAPPASSPGPGTPGPSGSTSPAPGGGSTAAIQPCSLLSPAELSGLGTFEQGAAPEVDAGARPCAWKMRASNPDDDVTIAVAVRDSQGLSEVNDAGGGKQTGKVNDRPAVQAQVPASNGCIIALGVGQAARVDVAATLSSAKDPKTACATASKAADIVEPKLPKG